MNDVTHIVVLITCKDGNEAERISTSLIKPRLAACTNIIPNIRSVFRWQGAIEEETEVLLIAKSQFHHFTRITEIVENEHSYDTPEIIALPVVAGSKAYLSWISEETNPG